MDKAFSDPFSFTMLLMTILGHYPHFKEEEMKALLILYSWETAALLGGSMLMTAKALGFSRT